MSYRSRQYAAVIALIASTLTVTVSYANGQRPDSLIKQCEAQGWLCQKQEQPLLFSDGKFDTEITLKWKTPIRSKEGRRLAQANFTSIVASND